MTSITSHKDLEVWKLAMDVAETCYRITRGFPGDEAYGMTAQIRRAAVSIAANIAEGFGRESTKSFIHFLRVGQGSQKELESHLLICRRVQLIDERVADRLLADVDRLGRMLRNLIRSLEPKLSGV